MNAYARWMPVSEGQTRIISNVQCHLEMREQQQRKKNTNKNTKKKPIRATERRHTHTKKNNSQINSMGRGMRANE